jgi:acetoin utilization protein AcuC
MPEEASGFCVYDDPAVAIAWLLANGVERVAYVDVDVHHGDGPQAIFYDEPRVLTVSLHQSGRYLYPGTGFEDEIGGTGARGTAANLPLEPGTGREDYLWALESLLDPLAAAFGPDVVVTQLGADTHWGDPLANLGLTMPAYPRMASILHRVVHERAGGRWVATGGGGYQADTVVPKVWTMHFAEMVGRTDLVPADWLHDRGDEEVSRSYRSDVARRVETVLQACVPRLTALATA